MQPPSILIVDDSAPMRRTIASLLRKVVGESHECSDGDEALEAYARYRPDWVLMDIKMERVDGLDATRQIVAAFPDANVAIITNFDEPGMQKKASEAGARVCLLKDDLTALRKLIC